ncbi:hypothetical protein Rxycam_02577 [Rubrobacter xylanophilus DSM 9941]|uniref:DedA family protein n=1 Tax=Rubrobacter xylanophilus TaxID=49319 RepID=UPI001C63F113|nr:DedA family protein [Rubrobacter xylanophilus]QYJ16742.1 hypothetical protein Rxycam_02577 [Rubrobacter xylanophilus DSM 9941]
MPDLAGWASEVIRSLGYAGVILVMIAENLFPPIPSEVVLPFVGFMVSRGHLAFVPALAAATLGSLVGAYALYALGRWGGRPLILRYSWLLRVSKEDLDRADGWFDRYGGWIVFFGRMVPTVRSIVSIPAGLSEMPLGRFTLLTVAGSAIWNTALISAGLFFGENWRRAVGYAESASPVLLGAAVVAALAAWWLLRRRTRRRREAG